jgi:hypothetical protein
MFALSPHRSSGGCSRHSVLDPLGPGTLRYERSSNLKAHGATAIHLVLPNRPVILVAAWLNLHTPGHLQSQTCLSTSAKYFVLTAGDVETKETNWHSRLFKHLRNCASGSTYLICGPHTSRPGYLVTGGPGFESRWRVRIFSSRPDRLRDPSNPLYNGYRVSFARVRPLTHSPHLAPGLNSTATFTLPHLGLHGLL